MISPFVRGASSSSRFLILIGLHGEVVVEIKAGDFLFIPAGVWHQPMNVSDRPVVAIEARAGPDDQSNVNLAPNQP
ncbi:cupin domain-containing protein [Vulcanococcus sp.]|uniref:cupin domain-containing protein n=1 Tax=Vulcanococcus sp. TaxID=2856995 RepID=UPI0034399BD0